MSSARSRGCCTWRDRDDADARRDGRIRMPRCTRQVLELWQTAMLRLSRLQVKDEIDNGLAYYRYTFLDEIPRLYAALEIAGLARNSAPTPRACRRSCGWARGSAAIATAIRTSTPTTLSIRDSRAGGVALEHYLDEVHRLGAELSLSTRLVTPTPELAGARRGGAAMPNPHRQDEPYRQALIGVYARLAATARALDRPRRRRARRTSTRCRMRTSREFIADLDAIARVARDARRRAARGAAARSVAARRRRVRLSSGGARPAAEQRRARSRRRRAAARGPASSTTTRRWPRRRASRCSSRELGSPRLLHSPHSTIRSATRSELAILRVAADIHARFGARRAAELRDLQMPVGVRPARGRACC